MTAADSPALLHRSQSLTRQLARRGFWLALVAALGLGGALALGLRTALQSLDRQLAEVSMTAATTFDRFLLSLQSELIATGALLPSSRQPEAVLRQLMSRNLSILDALVIDRQGRVAQQQSRVGRPALATLVLAAQPNQTETLRQRGVFVSSVRFEQERPYLELAVPMADEIGLPVGFLVVRVELTELWEQAVNLRVGRTGYVYLADRSGQLLAYRDRALLAEGTMVQALVGRAPEAIARAEISWQRGLAGPWAIAAGQPLEAVPWFVLVEQPAVEALVPFILPALLLLGVLLGIAIAVYSTVDFNRRRVVQPLQSLREAANQLAQGNWQQVVASDRPDELGELAATFNRMAAQLRHSFAALAEANSELEQRVAERTAELHQQRHFLQQIVDTDPNLIFVQDAAGRFIFANQAIADQYGTSVANLLGKTEAELGVAPTEAEQFWRANQAVLASGTTQIVEEALPRATGETRYYLTIKTPLQRDDLPEPYLLGVSTDMTAQRQTAVELAAAKQAADAANQAKSEFLANMSHELRTPLNGILGYAQILRRAEDLNRHRKGVETIQQSGEHLLTLINDVLDLAKIEARKLELLPRDFHLPAFLLGIVEIIRLRTDQKGLEFNYQPDPNLPEGVRTDDKRLRQVLLNLLSNAAKFTEEGSVTFQVEILGREEAAEETLVTLRFTVRDTGLGMSAEQLTKIFLPFEQVGEARRQSEGTGLGLAISQQIVEMLGSEIQVSSTPGAGSTFWFVAALPLSNEWAEQATSSDRGKLVGYAGDRRTILVIDDKDVNRAVIQDLLASLGFTVLEAENGEVGLALIASQEPDLIITDLVMPVLDGFAVAQRLQDSPYAAIPLIASSASVSEAEQSEAIAAGCDDFLPKPVEFDKLLRCLQKYLGLAWRYEGEDSAPLPLSMASQPCVSPPLSELVVLEQAARIGDIATIEVEVERLRRLDPQYREFCDRLGQLAAEFDDRGIQQLLARAGSEPASEVSAP